MLNKSLARTIKMFCVEDEAKAEAVRKHFKDLQKVDPLLGLINKISEKSEDVKTFVTEEGALRIEVAGVDFSDSIRLCL